MSVGNSLLCWLVIPLYEKDLYNILFLEHGPVQHYIPYFLA